MSEGHRVEDVPRQDMLRLEAHHRIANSLQIIASILLLKMRAAQSNETRQLLREMHGRLILVATVQRQICTSIPTRDVALDSYLTKLCDDLACSMVADDHPVTVTVRVTAGIVESDDATRFGAIVTELVINSLKHGFPDGRKGRITVDFQEDHDGWRLEVSDDGVGRQPSAGNPEHSGIGTRIVESLAQYFGARVEYATSSHGAATIISAAGSMLR